MNKIEIRSILFLGVGGISMYQLALAFKNLGVKCYGYDAKESKYTKICSDEGIEVVHKFNKDFLDVDLCVKTGAIKAGKFISRLTKRGVKIIDRSVALAWLSSKFKKVIAVAGTHGKTTTATLIYEMLRRAGNKVSCHIGAEIGNARFSINDDYLVVEACEYNKSFLSLFPDISVVTNVEAEHMDCYGSIFHLRTSFIKFLKRARSRYVFRDESTKFLNKYKNFNFVDMIENVNSKLHGDYNKKNISLAGAVARDLGVDEKVIREVISTFSGVARRYEYIGNIHKSKVFVDYAHHPTELRAFTSTFRQDYKDNLIIFQPHTYSRTKIFFSEFIDILTDIENLIIYKEYPAREVKLQGKRAKDLYDVVKLYNKKVKYCASPKELTKLLGENTAISFVGAGDIETIARKIVKTYSKNT